MEKRVESAFSRPDGPPAGLRIRMLGRLTLECNGNPLPLPASRKVRALLAYLALAPYPLGRGRLCELLWETPNDPRGELRWSLSKLRKLVEADGRRRVVVSGELVSLDLEDCCVDARRLAILEQPGGRSLDPPRLAALAGLFAGEFLEGLELARSPPFEGWLLAQRRRFKALRIALLRQLVAGYPADSEEALSFAETWVALEPFDSRAQVALLLALAGRGRYAEGEAHLASAERLYQAEGLEFGPLRTAWREARNRRPAGLSVSDPAVWPPTEGPASGALRRRASLAVMPFRDAAGGGRLRGGLADGLTHDIIARLAKLKSLFVIARGSVFALAEQGLGPEEAGRRLRVDYIAGGELRRRAGRLQVTLELVEVGSARIVWTEVFDCRADDTFLVLDTLGDRIVSSIAQEIEAAETRLAVLKPPSSLNAWEAYHRGLWHMYRFTREDNEQARHFFETATRLDPTFARAHAGKSFTHWQSAFQHWADRRTEGDRAYEAAGQGLMIDDQDPAVHWAMGRALWLRDRREESLDELQRAVDLSPNFALGHYSLAFVQSQSGNAEAAIAASDHSRQLSPFDPLLFGMLGTRAMALVRLGRFDEAATWAVRAAARPNAHAIILAIAALCLALAGRVEEGRVFVASIRGSLPHYRIADFLATFRFTPDAAALFRRAAARVGLD